MQPEDPRTCIRNGTSDQEGKTGIPGTKETEMPLKRRNEENEGERDSYDGIQPAFGYVEAANRVLYHSGTTGRLFLATIVISLGLAVFVYTLDLGISGQFTIIAASSFTMHAQLGAVNTASTIINGVAKPLVGKLADLTSRPTAYIISLAFYVVGYAVAATCQNFVAYAVGVSFSAAGKAGLNLLSQIIVGDLTTLQWRGFWTSMTIAPYLVTTFVNGFISERFVPNEWRVGLGMFAAMLPVVAAPAIAALYGVQRRARKLGLCMEPKPNEQQESLALVAWNGLVAIDLPGLILLGFSFSLILLPLSLAKSADCGWKNPSMIAMEVVGWVILGMFVAYEIYVAPVPIMSKPILANRVFLAGLGANLFNQMVGTLGSNYFASYMYVIKGWDNYTWTVFTGIQFLAVTVFSLLGGVLQVKYHRYKSQMIVGAVCQVVGYAMCLTGKHETTQSTVVLAISQILMGVSALTALGSRVGAMASVSHKDMASIIAAYFLWTYLGSAAGYAIASAIWTANMPKFMREELPGVSDEVIDEIYGSIEILRTHYEAGARVREGAIRAYTRTNGIIFITAAVISSLSILFSLLMPNYYLGEQHNVATGIGLDGEKVDEPPPRDDATARLWTRLKQRMRCLL